MRYFCLVLFNGKTYNLGESIEALSNTYHQVEDIKRDGKLVTDHIMNNLKDAGFLDHELSAIKELYFKWRPGLPQGYVRSVDLVYVLEMLMVKPADSKEQKTPEGIRINRVGKKSVLSILPYIERKITSDGTHLTMDITDLFLAAISGKDPSGNHYMTSEEKMRIGLSNIGSGLSYYRGVYVVASDMIGKLEDRLRNINERIAYERKAEELAAQERFTPRGQRRQARKKSAIDASRPAAWYETFMPMAIAHELPRLESRDGKAQGWGEYWWEVGQVFVDGRRPSKNGDNPVLGRILDIREAKGRRMATVELTTEPEPIRIDLGILPTEFPATGKRPISLEALCRFVPRNLLLGENGTDALVQESALKIMGKIPFVTRRDAEFALEYFQQTLRQKFTVRTFG